MVELFANSGDPDQVLHSAVSDMGLHCLSSSQFSMGYGVPIFRIDTVQGEQLQVVNNLATISHDTFSGMLKNQSIISIAVLV